MRVGRYLPGMSPEAYRALPFFDRRCILESLDVLIARENGEKPPEEADEVDPEIEAEARRAAENRLDEDGLPRRRLSEDLDDDLLGD